MPHFDKDVRLDFKDVELRAKKGSTSTSRQVNIEKSFKFVHSKQTFSGVPIIASNSEMVGRFEVAEVLAMRRYLVAINKHYTLKDWKGWAATACGKEALPFVMISTGILEREMEKLHAVLKAVPAIKMVCVNSPNFSQAFTTFVCELRSRHQNITIVAGNVQTKEMTEELILCGADVVKVGSSSGAATAQGRRSVGGEAHFSILMECAEAAHGLGGFVIADGGCVSLQDVSKAFGAGGDFAMLDNLFLGHKECAGELVEDGGARYKVLHIPARQAGGPGELRIIDPTTVKAPYRGEIEETLTAIRTSLKQACTLVGAGKLVELPKRAAFARVSAKKQSRETREPSPVAVTHSEPSAKRVRLDVD
eukprot:TRINITY_DN11885_c0_g1_i1.p1 TRINITY_DN11885_c0_g1~~TRINITY_DN11885_c0_g1_i1.p1  ORF type:complete len:388 (-),score=60.22 TRINITY_DN11885_c0_g1_i1:33-1124(-)